MAKRELTVTLEIATPMLLAGINQNKPELRPPSVLGQLRYWLRAALGGAVGDSLKALKESEAEVFGDTSGTGAVSVRIPQSDLTTSKYNPLPHKDTRTRFYGFDPGQQFDVCLSQRTPQENTWLAAISALLLMVSFGGLGRRCRRGWGTVKIIKMDVSKAHLHKVWQDILSSKPPNTSQRWIDYAKACLDIAKHCTGELCPLVGLEQKAIQLSHSYLSFATVPDLFISKTIYTGYEAAISNFGEIEHQCLKDKRLPEKSIGYARDGRQASPLWLRVFPVESKEESPQYIMLATLFNVQFSGANYKAVKKFLTEYANFREVPR